MKTKAKISLGIGFLFALIVCMGAACIFFVNSLSRDSKAIIKDNLASLDYVESINRNLDILNNSVLLSIGKNNSAIDIKSSAIENIEDKIRVKINAESGNITEAGERQAADSLKLNFEEYTQALQDWNSTGKSAGLFEVNQMITKNLDNIYRVNQKAILRKNDLASHTASKAITYITIIGTIFFLVAFVFIINFPGYIANPIRELSDKIRAIADGDFSQRLNIDNRNDEFGIVATSFNYLAKKLQEFKDSNVNEITIQKTRIESIVNNLDEAIILMDENQKIISANPVAADLLGLRNEDLVGQNAGTISQKNDLFRTLVTNLPAISVADKTPLRITFDGQENYFQKYIHPITQYDEWKQETKPAGYVIVMKNITEFKRLDIAKTNFMATLSHELKTPLSSINLSLKLILDERIGKLSAEQTQLIDNIRHESQRLLKYVNELLDFSQIESGNIKLDIIRTEASNIVNLSLEAMRPTFEQKHIHTESIMEENLPMINADVEKTVWVMTNLLSNAARFSSEGSKLYIAVKRNAGDILFSVKDNGPGIDPRYHDKIFERFVQVYNNGNKGGTGLGLAIAKDFIEAQGGTIKVESAPGEGSTFIFSLPIA